jgi:vacuole morphology and inheritance protein 14
MQEFLKEITSVVELHREEGIRPTSVISRPVSQLSETTDPQIPNDPLIPGQGIPLDFSKMILTLAKYLSCKDEETRATCLRWIITFISLAKRDMLVFTPVLVNAILPTLAHPVFTIKSLAMDANTNLYNLVLETFMTTIDISQTVIILIKSCEDEHKETRVGALEWLLMLHKKYPVEVIGNEELFQGLLKMLSDFSEEVVRRDLQLLAQISQSADDVYFVKFMTRLVRMFGSDRRVLETRGGLIIRQLSLSLNPERMFRSFGQILEEEGDLEFATTMVQTLNMILITAPELSDMRRRLKNIDSRDGMALFTSLYKSWCHNPIACFSLCLLSQAYEHASNLLTNFGELEITVPFLIQTDKLVQLLESPVFTSLRLQLLEPEKYPHLYKCLYGILMLLPQSSAFSTLRNRLTSLSSLSALTINNTTTPPNNSKKKTIDPTVMVKWAELLSHFKLIQARHEKARRACKGFFINY